MVSTQPIGTISYPDFQNLASISATDRLCSMQKRTCPLHSRRRILRLRQDQIYADGQAPSPPLSARRGIGFDTGRLRYCFDAVLKNFLDLIVQSDFFNRSLSEQAGVSFVPPLAGSGRP